jgi:hypothetical protein
MLACSLNAAALLDSHQPVRYGGGVFWSVRHLPSTPDADSNAVNAKRYRGVPCSVSPGKHMYDNTATFHCNP